MQYKFTSPLIPILCTMALAGCGSSGGGSNPPAPPAPVAPPEPTFEQRLADLAAFDQNACRAETPGFEALGGWLKNDGREIGGSRVWLRDNGKLDAPADESHAAAVNATFNACGVREIARYVERASIQDLQRMIGEADLSHGLLISSSFFRSPEYGTDPLEWFRFLDNDGDASGTDAMLITALGNGDGDPTAHAVDYSEVPNVANTEYFHSLAEALKPENRASALWILVGGYAGEGDGRAPASGSSICGDSAPLCLFAPWRAEGRTDTASKVGTSFATPQVSAALDAVWAIWPDMDILDLRNLAFDCAENRNAAGAPNTERAYSYSSGRSFTSATNSTWGHGILSLTCLFTPNGGLQNPVTGAAISGGIFGPIAGLAADALIMGVDYTGRDFGHGFARPMARENFALAAAANLRAWGALSRPDGLGHAPGAFRARVAQRGRFAVDLAAAGDAIALSSGWRVAGLIVRGGLAVQPEGAGPLTGSRAFRAPATVSAAVTAAYGRTLRFGFSAHAQADHWRTLVAKGRSLWEGADLRESRVSAALAKRAGRHEFALQAVWRSGLSGSLDVNGRTWAVAPKREAGLWLTWNLIR